ncbi:hypothetical protein [Methylobacterium cerastii]|uniref:hypothetical protein n=1 Tax=Methylobacterium cerastii TaxID=932741 RepID=UPI001EE26D6D|nr:hypothetical protein [Methylobacterium cerastii]
MMRFLKRWRSKLPSSTKNFEKDHAAIMAMIGDFKDKRFREIPPDPRQVDPERLRQLRERLTNKYAYQWRATEANGELVDALFHTITESDGTRMGLGPAKITINDKGVGPPIFVGPRGHVQIMRSSEYKLHYYITAHSINVLDFVNNYDHALRLLNNLLPGCGFSVHALSKRTVVRLEKDGQSGPWIECGSVALGLVLAILDHAERRPEDLEHWRSI